MDELEYVRDQLRRRERNLREIADGAEIGRSWLRMFARGNIPDPGYTKVHKLASYFRLLHATGSHQHVPAQAEPAPPR